LSIIKLCIAARTEFAKARNPEPDFDPNHRGTASGAARMIGIEKLIAYIMIVEEYEAAREGLPEAYKSRGIAKSRLGDKVGACEDFRFACVLGNSEACENSKRVCN
jgi:hypothetical protein